MSIKRSFTSPYTPNSRRQFCGYCGTQLTSWNERTRDEADHISLTVGSLLDEDQEMLGELGFLPSSSESSDDEVSVAGPSRTTDRSRTVARSEPQSRGAPWFEEIVRNTRLGRFKQQRGGHTESGVHVEWEVTEWTEGDDGDDEGSHGNLLGRGLRMPQECARLLKDGSIRYGNPLRPVRKWAHKD